VARKPDALEQQLAALRRLQFPEGTDELRKALAGRRAGAGIAIAAAAKLVAEHHLELAPDLIDAFAWLRDVDEQVARDPGCRGKTAIARALHDLEHWDDGVFVVGLRIVQEQSGEDTAAELRGICGLAHAHFGRPDALDVLAELLADPQRATRIAAAQGIGDTGRIDATALLRYALLSSDETEAEVLAACFDSLFDLDRESSIPFAIARLADRSACAESAALALGSRRATAAVPDLIAWCGACTPEQRHRVGYLALALVRADSATEFLLDVVRTRSRADALAAAKALATFKDDSGVAKQLREAAAGAEPAVARALADLLR
jgi:HEAT repeat protein